MSDFIDNATVLAAQAGDKTALEALTAHMRGRIEGYAKTVTANANDYQEDVQDIIQEGFVAMLSVLPSWDPERGHFETFAYRRMRGAMVEGREAHSNTPSIPTDARKRYLRIMRAANFDASQGEEIAPDMGMSRGNFADVHRAMTMTTSISAYDNAEGDGDDEGSDAFEIPDSGDDYQTVVDYLFGQEMLKHLAPPLGATERERKACHVRARVVDLTYGLTSREPMLQRDVGEAVGLDQSVVARHLAKAIEIMQEATKETP